MEPLKESDYVVPAEIAGHPAWFRLEGQRTYYSSNAAKYQTHYRRIKIALITLAAVIPVLVFIPGDPSRFVVAAAGVAIAVLEGWLLLNQYGPLWVKYRTTAESLKRERWLLLSGAGDYKGLAVEARMGLLAERVEALLAEEQQAWTEAQKKALEELAKTKEWVQKQAAEAKSGAADTTTGAAGAAASAAAGAAGAVGAGAASADAPADEATADAPVDAPVGHPVDSADPAAVPAADPAAVPATDPANTPAADQRPPVTSTTVPVQ